MKENKKTITHYLFADLVLDVQRGELTRKSVNIALPKLSYDLLVALVGSAPALLSQQELMQKVWPERVIGDETLKQRVKLLRKTLGDDAANPFYIEAVRGRGYRLLPKVTCNCIVQKPPSVMLDLSANDKFPSFTINQISEFWRMLSKGGLAILFLLISVITTYSYFTSVDKNLDNSRLVLLPFKHQLPESKRDLVNKVRDTLINALSTSTDKQLISPSFVSDFSVKEQSLGNIAQKFNAGLVIEGDIYLSLDNQLNVMLRLTDVNLQALIWHGEFNTSIKELSDLQQQLSISLIATLSGHKNIQRQSKPPHNEVAYQYFEKAKQYYKRYRKVDNAIAIDFFNKAIAADPEYSLAYAGLSQAYSQQLFQFDGAEHDGIKAIDNAYQAITYDNRSAEAFKALSSAYYVSGWLSKSINANLSALQLASNNIEIMTNLGFMYSEQGELARGLALSKKALLVDPSYVVAMVHLGITLQRLSKYQQAQQWFEKAIAAQPDYVLATYHLGQLYIEKGYYGQALKLYESALKRHKNHALLMEGLADSHLYAGRLSLAQSFYQRVTLINKEEDAVANENMVFSRSHLLSMILAGETSEQKIAELISFAENRHVKGSDKSADSYNLALLYAHQNNNTMAIRYLVQAVEQGFMSLYFIEKQPLFNVLHAFSAYQKIIVNVQQKRQKQIKTVNDLR
ncbi:MAG: DNA-binding winged helix-turn-helix (wHTH) protein/tetratricopeptide (TPR) repeat protein [Alteromonadaceae bacterium]|jgi:DNA-binding winged helix-turn-helix (wHTH) protein/tetratricopeptide (TPR) repeat protein